MHPVPVDLDGDGDFDVIRSNSGGGFTAFRNDGVTLQEDSALLDGNVEIKSGTGGLAVFADIDGDGDYDLIVGQGGMDSVGHYENTGSATMPFFEKRLDKHHQTMHFNDNSPFANTYVHERFKPAFVDLDADGDLDYVAVSNYALRYYENTGSLSSPVFEERSGDSNPFKEVPVSGEGGFGIAFKDLDGDGDYDAILCDRGVYKVYLNAGTASGALFEGTESTDNPFKALSWAGTYGFNSQNAMYQNAPQFFPAPTTIAPGSSASASGDPHVKNILGQEFEIRRPGEQALLNVPRGALASDALLHLSALVSPATSANACSAMFITRIEVGGRWMGASSPLTFSAGSAAPGEEGGAGLRVANSSSLTVEEFMSMVPARMAKVTVSGARAAAPAAVNRHASTMVARLLVGPGVHIQVSWVSELLPSMAVFDSLWVSLTGLSAVREPVGGLLGLDDHQIASAADPTECWEEGKRRPRAPAGASMLIAGASVEA